MKKNTFIGVLTAIIIGAIVAVGVQAFSQSAEQVAPTKGVQEGSLQSTIVIQQVTLVPHGDNIVSKTPLALKRASPMPIPPTTEVQNPTSEPLENAPAPAVLAADQPILRVQDFSIPDLSTWTFDQVFWDPVPAPSWSVKNDQYVRDVLVAPENHDAITSLNDTIALVPETLNGDGSIEVSAMASSAEKVGLVVGYSDTHSYAIVVFSTDEAYGLGQTGVSLLHVKENSPAVISNDTTLSIDGDRWYRLRLDITGTTVHASLDGEVVLTTTLPDGENVRRVGLYAGSEGNAFFDNLQVAGK